MNAQEEQIYEATILANRALILQVVENHYPEAVIDAMWGGYTDKDMYDAIKEKYFPEMDDADYDNAYYSITGDDEDEDAETYTCAKCALQFALKDEGIRNTCFECDMPYCNDCMCEKNGKCYDCLDDEDADDGEWCNEDCEKNEGCIKCNPFAYCSPATLEEWLGQL